MKKHRAISFLTICLLLILCLASCAQNCAHRYVDEIVVQTSCSAAGIQKSTCSLCGYYYEATIPKADHTYDEGKITAEPTYFSAGSKQYTCTQCGNHKKETIPKISFDAEYNQGTYKCPDEIPAGEYILISSSNRGYFSINADPMGNDIMDNDNFGPVSHIRIVSGTYLELRNCIAIPYSDEITFDIVDKDYISGTYKVGKDIPAGTYKLTAFSGGYYCIQSKPQGSIIKNDFFDEGSCYITLKKDQYVTFNKVKINKA